jgi:Zn-dependent protease
MLGLSLAVIVARGLVLIIALPLHELAHALTADYLGDPTPRRMGRITLNPLKHLDPAGTIMLFLAGFGWAKPVMVQPLNMRGDPRRSMAIVAIAGPLTNITLAVLASIPFQLGWADFTFTLSGDLPTWDYFLSQFIWINLILAFFNILPIPPLDGSRILFAIVPAEMAYQLRPLEQYGFIILFALIFLVPGFERLFVTPSLTVLGWLIPT